LEIVNDFISYSEQGGESDMSLLKRIERGQQPTTRPGQDAPAGSKPLNPPPANALAAPPAQTRIQEMMINQQAVAPARADPYLDLKRRIQDELLDRLDPKMDASHSTEVREVIQEEYDAILARESMILSRAERQRLFEQICADILGFGPIQPLLEDETVSEIMVNGPKHIYVERRGKLEKAGVTFESNDHVMRIIDRIVSPLGRRIDESSPYVDARLPDGSRVNAIIPPLAVSGPTLTIRKFSKKPLTVEDLVKYGSITEEAIQFLQACVLARLNVVVSGGTGSGKTTLLNVLSGFIPDDERIITVENAAELQLRQEHVITLESRPPNIEGRGEVTIRDLVVNCLRMRPDRIVVGECRGGEALDMLQAMNTGHDGSLTTLHANTDRDALSRLETMCLMSGMDLPVRAIREQIAAAVDVIVQQERMRDGSRKIISITEIQGMEGDIITMSQIFEFQQAGYEGGRVIGRLRPTGIRPKFMSKIEQANIRLAPEIFGIDMRRF
jgi:pilus assembly protein CpaF